MAVTSLIKIEHPFDHIMEPDKWNHGRSKQRCHDNFKAFDVAAMGRFLSVHHGSTTWSEFKDYDIDRPYDRGQGLWESCPRQVPARAIMSKLQQVIRDEIEQQGFDADGFDIMGSKCNSGTLMIK